MRKHLAQLQIGCGQPDDRRLVQLRRDGAGQRQQFAELDKLGVFLFTSRSRRIFALLLHFALAR